MMKTMLVFILLCAAILPALCCGVQDSYCQERFRYDSHGKRDPFFPLVAKDKAMVPRLEDVRLVEEIRIEGIASGPRGERVAILNGEMAKEKSRFGNLVVKKIDSKEITVSINGIDYKLNLRKEE